MKSRIFHRTIGPLLVLPLLVILATGATYRIARSWFGIPKETGWKILDIHTGEWMGEIGSLIWVGVSGLGLLAMLCTGAHLLLQRGGRQPLRRWHRIVGLVLLLPLFATTLTGLAYRFGEAFFKTSESFEDILMMVHQGSWLGKPFSPFYILLLALGLLTLAATGLQMRFRRAHHHPAQR
ncbi:MAG: PepSY-associated TM helix domain-containing protein [Terrimicrobiaceae bacterium]|nr:PepSY-associated TM helix domain-containing protein [Terrimicrobiaceae bacterium]